MILINGTNDDNHNNNHHHHNHNHNHNHTDNTTANDTTRAEKAAGACVPARGRASPVNPQTKNPQTKKLRV